DPRLAILKSLEDISGANQREVTAARRETEFLRFQLDDAQRLRQRAQHEASAQNIDRLLRESEGLLASAQRRYPYGANPAFDAARPAPTQSPAAQSPVDPAL
ncbi:hypothetical protein DIPPA_19888, partial [Diplonema papillatum]